MALFRKLADQDGRLMSQNHHPVRVWMPGSFVESRDHCYSDSKIRHRHHKKTLDTSMFYPQQNANSQIEQYKGQPKQNKETNKKLTKCPSNYIIT